jgi:hypothetical protein
MFSERRHHNVNMLTWLPLVIWNLGSASLRRGPASAWANLMVTLMHLHTKAFRDCIDCDILRSAPC